MSVGVTANYVVTMSANASLTSDFNLRRTWNSVFLEIPTMVSNSIIYIQAAAGQDSTGALSYLFRRVYHPMINSAAPTANLFQVNTGVTNCMIPIPNGFRHLKIETAESMAVAVQFRVVVAD